MSAPGLRPAALAGLSVSRLGGESNLAVPIFVYALSLETKPASALSLERLACRLLSEQSQSVFV